ncbi:MAG: sigma-54 interaction domain-containing protein [Solirubrobacterales bacterium]
MVKKVAIITFMASAARFYSNQLKELFGDTIETSLYSIEEHIPNNLINADIMVVSTYSIFETIKNNISIGSEIVIPNLTFSKTALGKIKEIPKGSKCMLVNSSVDMCIDTISLISQLGINDIEFVPVYPGMNEVPNLDIAVTPGEGKFVPKNVKQLLDVGDRIIDTSTMIEIALKLDLEYFLKDEKFISYFEKIATNSYSLEMLAGKTTKLESQFDILLRILDEGIIGVNANGIIFALNSSAESIIGRLKGEVIGRKAKDVLSDIPFVDVINSFDSIKNRLVKINDAYVDLSVEPVISGNSVIGAFATVKKFKDTEVQQQKLRLQLLNRGYRAKYTFDDIIGESSIIVKTKKRAEKMAKTNSPVLITGESGTGKELFAQALHNSSYRRESPFVAVNCAAIPDNLLESELFGYEDGAFTGAKKGGKPGLFEFAHMGTLFLDEIEAMSLNLQSKLLRILQEKEVVRIGGDRVISVDVRIIATTNENLEELIHKGRFRKDLYYRLNVLPLYIPPLRERENDVLIILEKIKRDLNSSFHLNEEIENLFLNYSFDGNIRELRNYIEYLTCLSEENISMEDLPINLINHGNRMVNSKAHIDINEYKDFLDEAGDKLNNYTLVLQQLALCYKNRKGIGRRALSKIMENNNIFLTEPEIRTIFINLERHNMITVSIGRGGSKLTEKGLNYINSI